MLVTAYAKINLGLRIIRKRSDGYHDLETIFHLIDWHDEIVIRPSDESVSLAADDSGLPLDESNLCLKAALRLRTHTGTTRGAHLHLTKRIPVGSGLGGGSSDAAAVLRGLSRFWGLNLEQRDLMSIGASLGADVPFFLSAGSAFAQERGDRLHPLKIDVPYWILVVVPPIQVSTSWAYQQVHPAGENRAVPRNIIDADHLTADAIMPFLVNDFEPPVFRAHPAIEAVKRTMIEAGARAAQMSGSGSAVFGLFSDEGQASGAARMFGSEYRYTITKPNFSPPRE